MHFGESLVRLKSDILAGYKEREMAAGVRESTLSHLRADVRQALARNAARRVELAKSQSVAAVALREKLAADAAQREQAVEQTRQSNRRSLEETSKTIAANAEALRASLGAFCRQSASEVAAFRAGVRADQAASAVAVAAELKSFVEGVKEQSDGVRHAVRHQLDLVRGAWGHSAPAVVTVAKVSAKADSVEAVTVDEKAESAVAPTPAAEFEMSAPSVLKETGAGFARGRKRESAKASAAEGEGETGNIYSAGQTE